MHRTNRVGVQRVAVQQRALGRQVVAVDEDDDAIHANVHRHFAGVGVKSSLLSFVLGVEANEAVVHDRAHHDDDPRALLKFGEHEDQHDDGGHAGRERVDEDPAAPVATLLSQVTSDHTGASQRKAREDTDRVERDERVDRRVKGNDQDQRHDPQYEDAVREGQAVSTFGELTGQIFISRHVVRQKGKPVERRVAAGEKNKDGRELDHEEDVVAKAVGAKDVEYFLTHDRRRARGVGNRVGPVRQQRGANK